MNNDGNNDARDDGIMVPNPRFMDVVCQSICGHTEGYGRRS